MTTPENSEVSLSDFSTITADAIRSLRYPVIRRYVEYKFVGLMPREDLEKLKDAALNGRTYLEGIWANYWTFNLGLRFGSARIITEDVCRLLKVKDIIPGQPSGTDPSHDWLSVSKDRKLKPRMARLLGSACQVKQLLKENMGAVPDIAPFISTATTTTLPFPYIGASRPEDRFNLFQNEEEDDSIYQFTFHGLEVFRKIMGELNKISSGVGGGRGYEGVWVMGTEGNGKSFEMAKLALYLLAHTKRVIYIPNSRACTVSPVMYLQSAFVLAYANDLDLITEISNFESKEDITRFVKSRQDNEDFIFFIIDNYGALETKNRMDKPDELKLGTRAVIREWLLQLSAPPHHRILCSSSNDISAHEMLSKPNSSGYLPVYMLGGYTRHEFNACWRRVQDRLSDGEKKDQMLYEKVTGKVPLLLDKATQPGHEGDPWKRLDLFAGQACQFSENVQKWSSEAEFRKHKEFVKGRILQQPVALNIDYYLIDHRYFYRDGVSGIGYCTNLVVSDAMWRWLSVQQPGLFTAKDFITIIRSFAKNPSVIGFAVEAACLTSICSNGLPISEGPEGVKAGIAVPMRPFSCEYPAMLSDEAGATLHCPSVFNFSDIDAIICSREPKPRGTGPRRVTLIPMQITLDPNSHSDSEKGFFTRISTWTSGWTSDWRFEYIFVWIGGKEPEKDVVKENALGMHHPEFIRITIPFEQLNPTIATTLSESNIKTGSKRKQKNTPTRKSAKKAKT